MISSSGPDTGYCVLSHIRLMAERMPGIFDDSFKLFFLKYNEPTHNKYLKLEILSLICNDANMQELTAELSEYVSDVNAEVCRRSLKAIGDIGEIARGCGSDY